MPAFSRFFDAVGYSHGEMVNYANVARDCGVDAKTVKEYYQILVDTLLGTLLEPFAKRHGREVLTKTPKFYLFDVGVAGMMCKRSLAEQRGSEFAKAFEHLILMELLAQRAYGEKDHRIRYWRTKTGYEVDFVLGEGEVAVEVKSGENIGGRELAGLRAFVEDHAPRKAIVVTTQPRRRHVDGIDLIPWRDFLRELWAGKII